jgi:hypothetical protein
MTVRRRKGVRAAFGALVVAFVCAGALVTSGAASASKKPLIGVAGSSYTQTLGITGQVTQQTNFSMSANQAQDGTVSGTFSYQQYNVAANGGLLDQVAGYNVLVECLSADKTSGTVWFSGLVTSGFDQQQLAEEQTQEQQIIGARQLILVGRFRDTNGDGIADERSLFVTHATQPYPNALISHSDLGTINSPWFINGNATSPANACLNRDSDYIEADYAVAKAANPAHPFGSVQWLAPDDSTSVGSPVVGTAANMANPPAASVYSLASFARTLLSPTLNLTIN